ncbi:MAG: hypothetical protein ACYDHW_08230 [Syntrophorhabdaceae bacterium]
MRKIIEPPDWWNLGLYDFIEKMPLEGWVWEFMRRSELKKILGHLPVDAMNPEPHLHQVENDNTDYYYMTWPEANTKYGRREYSFYRIPAVKSTMLWRIPGLQIPTPRGRWVTLDINLDLNRPNKFIVRDFKSLLNEIRTQENVPEPKKIKPHLDGWKILLIVWDLYQYKISQRTIANILKFDPSSQVDDQYIGKHVYNLYKEARRYIEDGGWEDFSRFI